MPREWSLTVEDFGRIERAEVTVKPLTVLVGPNNGGKSYLGTLVWGIESGGLNESQWSFDPVDETVRSWIARADRNPDSWTAWSDEEAQALRALWPAFVHDVMPELCRVLFDVDGLFPKQAEIGSAALSNTWYTAVEKAVIRDGEKRGHSFFWFTNRGTQPMPTAWDGRAVRRDPGASVTGILTDDPKDVPWAGNVLGFMAGFGDRGMRSSYEPDRPVFLPASRTGFSLFLPTFLQAKLAETLTQSRKRRAIARADGGPESRKSASFTLPHVHLMSGLTSAFGGQRGPYADEADRLERECLDGTIVVRAETGVANYAFRPDGASEDLGLQLSSALVTELMPLVVLLRYAEDLPFLVIEEPEAHLHPRLQRIVTRCLCRLVRRGVRVLITTHSTTVAQQINNLIKLGELDVARRASLQRRYGYDEGEHLDGDEVAIHEIRFVESGRAIVERLERSEGGFAMPTFNDDLEAFGEETLAFNASIDPEHDEDGP